MSEVDRMAVRRVSRFGTLEERFWSKVDKTDDCWNWTGSQGAGGYGTIRRPLGGNTTAHRVSYELFVGPIPEGLEIDHLCRNRGCVNPTHLEAVTHQENIRRSGPATKTECVNGHPLHGPNLYVRPEGGRECRACRKAAKGSFRHAARGPRGEVNVLVVIRHAEIECPRCGAPAGLPCNAASPGTFQAEDHRERLVALIDQQRGAVEDREWLRGIVYEFLLTGPRKRTGLSDVEMQRFLSIHVGGQ